MKLYELLTDIMQTTSNIPQDKRNNLDKYICLLEVNSDIYEVNFDIYIDKYVDALIYYMNKFDLVELTATELKDKLTNSTNYSDLDICHILNGIRIYNSSIDADDNTIQKHILYFIQLIIESKRDTTLIVTDNYYKSIVSKLFQCLSYLNCEIENIDDVYYVKNDAKKVKVTKWISATRELLFPKSVPDKTIGMILFQLCLNKNDIGTIFESYNLLQSKSTYWVSNNIIEIYDKCLHKTCMNNSSSNEAVYTKQILFYEIMDNCKILYGERSGSIVSRALMWQLPDGTWYLDRIYDYGSESRGNTKKLNLGTMKVDILDEFKNAYNKYKNGELINEPYYQVTDKEGQEYIISDMRASNGASSDVGVKYPFNISIVQFNIEKIKQLLMPILPNDIYNADDYSLYPFSDTYSLLVAQSKSNQSDKSLFDVRLIALNIKSNSIISGLFNSIQLNCVSREFNEKFSKPTLEYLSTLKLIYNSHSININTMGRKWSFIPITCTNKPIDYSLIDSYKVTDDGYTYLEEDIIHVLDLDKNIIKEPPIPKNNYVSNILDDDGKVSTQITKPEYTIEDIMGNTLHIMDAVQLLSDKYSNEISTPLIVHKAALHNESYALAVTEKFDYTQLSDTYDKKIPIPILLDGNVIQETRVIPLKSIAVKEDVVESINGNILKSEAVKIFDSKDYPDKHNFVHYKDANIIKAFLKTLGEVDV